MPEQIKKPSNTLPTTNNNFKKKANTSENLQRWGKSASILSLQTNSLVIERALRLPAFNSFFNIVAIKGAQAQGGQKRSCVPNFS